MSERAEPISGSMAHPACWAWKPPWPVGTRPADLFDFEWIMKLFAWQSYNGCGFCGKLFTMRRDRSGAINLAPMDHDGRTGMVRGMLCPSCNTMEGIEGAAKAHDPLWAMYREINPAYLLGMEMTYYQFQRCTSGYYGRMFRYEIEIAILYGMGPWLDQFDYMKPRGIKKLREAKRLADLAW